jgi:hypothetical protein
MLVSGSLTKEALYGLAGLLHQTRSERIVISGVFQGAWNGSKGQVMRSGTIFAY